jgi:malonate transporter and related proteins
MCRMASLSISLESSGTPSFTAASTASARDSPNAPRLLQQPFGPKQVQKINIPRRCLRVLYRLHTFLPMHTGRSQSIVATRLLIRLMLHIHIEAWSYTLLTTIIGALLPIVVILILGFFSGWHKDFTGDQAAVLNRMVMLYALPMLLFGSTVSIPRSSLLENISLAVAVAAGMVGSFLVVLLTARFVFQRDLGTSALQALTIGGPAVPFVGVSVLGYVFGPANESIPVISASLAMNLVQVPVCLMLLSAAAKRSSEVKTERPFFISHVIAAVREPIVWAPILAIILVTCGIRLPRVISQSMLLLGQATGGVALFASGVMLFARRVSINWIVALNAVARNLIVPAVFWGGLVMLKLPPAAVREAVITLAIPTAAMAVILAVEFKVAEQEMASSLLFSTVLSIPTMGAFMFLTA